jgi:heptose I phosphotransferase
VYFSLEPALKKYLATSADLFQQFMAMHGQIYRELEGRRTQRIELNGRGYFLKQHYGVGWKEIFKNIFQCRAPVFSAKNEWLALQRLQTLGVPTMQIAGYGSRGLNPARKQSFLLTEELTNVVSLEDVCKTWTTIPPTLKLKHALIKEVARMTRLLHSNGINHRDFYLCHFLTNTKLIPGQTPILYLIDLHRAQIRNETPARWIIKDLAGLYFSSKDSGLTSRDLLRFIREYRLCSWREVLTDEWTFWDKVKQRGDKLYRQHSN